MSFDLADMVEEYRAVIAELCEALENCANRFERCCTVNGTDPECAAIAVEKYRQALARGREALK